MKRYKAKKTEPHYTDSKYPELWTNGQLMIQKSHVLPYKYPDNEKSIKFTAVIKGAMFGARVPLTLNDGTWKHDYDGIEKRKSDNEWGRKNRRKPPMKLVRFTIEDGGAIFVQSKYFAPILSDKVHDFTYTAGSRGASGFRPVVVECNGKLFAIIMPYRTPENPVRIDIVKITARDRVRA